MADDNKQKQNHLFNHPDYFIAKELHKPAILKTIRPDKWQCNGIKSVRVVF
jgi:hypothetical protein